MATTAKRYGLPYKGSKNSIAPWVISHLPPAARLYDLFCGGCAITHAAMLSGKWRKVVANDIDGDMPYFRQFYLKKNRRIPKDVKAWGAKYLHALIEGVLDGDGSENRRVYCGARGLMDDVQEVCYKIGLSANIAKCEPHESYYQKENRIIKAHKPYYCLSINHRPLLSVIRRNQRLVPYNDMVNCVTLERWHTVLVRRNGKSVWCGQCDPPYFSTEQRQYRKLGEEGFDSLKFYDWCERQKALTIISEYDMPRDRFTCVAEVTKTSLASGTGAIQCVERLFTPNHQAEEYRHRMGRLF